MGESESFRRQLREFTDAMREATRSLNGLRKASKETERGFKQQARAAGRALAITGGALGGRILRDQLRFGISGNVGVSDTITKVFQEGLALSGVDADRQKALDIARQRTGAITGPIAEAGGKVDPATRRELLLFELDRALGLTGEAKKINELAITDPEIKSKIFTGSDTEKAVDWIGDAARRAFSVQRALAKYYSEQFSRIMDSVKRAASGR